MLHDDTIAKYHLQVLLLFVYNRSQERFGNAQETCISLRFEKLIQASAFVLVILTVLLLCMRTFVFHLRTVSGNLAAIFLKVKRNRCVQCCYGNLVIPSIVCCCTTITRK